MYPLLPEPIRPAAAWVFLAGSIAFAIAVIYITARGVRSFRRPSQRYLAVNDFIHAIAWLYPVGMLLKFSGFGPDFLRYWLGDVGFPVFIASMFVSLMMRRVDRVDPAKDYAMWLRDRRSFTTLNLWALGVAFLLSLGYEVMTGVMNATGPEGYSSHDFGIGSFDPIDVLMYAIGSGLAAWCWLYLRRLFENGLAAELEYQQKAAQQKRELALANAAAAPSAPKYRKKKRARHR